MPATSLPFWFAQALAADNTPPLPPLQGEVSADVCIVGGGFTGLWTAILCQQARPDWRVIVLEKSRCGAGASGRNGGCMLTWSTKYLSLRQWFGDSEARRLVAASEQAVQDIAQFCHTHQIDAELRLGGAVYAASQPAQVGRLDGVLAALDHIGANRWQRLSSADTLALTGSAQMQHGAWTDAAGSLQPGKLVRGLLRVARELGVEVYEGSPMQRLDAGQPALVQTPEAIVHARKVVLALNSAMTAHFLEFRRSIVLVSSDMVITDPAPNALAAQQLAHGHTVVDGRTFVHYYRSTPQGRLMLGKGGNTFAELW